MRGREGNTAKRSGLSGRGAGRLIAIFRNKNNLNVIRLRNELFFSRSFESNVPCSDTAQMLPSCE